MKKTFFSCRVTLLTALAGCWLGGAHAAWADRPYVNPVIGSPEHVDKEVADPFVLKWNGEYYLYCSGDPITAYHSVDLVHWDPLGPVLGSTPQAWNSADLWAPEVVYQDGNFYLYYTAARASGDWRVTENSRRIGVAVSASPRGPFVDSGWPLTPYWAIDATVFRDPAGGNQTMFVSHVNEETLQGAAIVCDRLTSPTAVSGQPNLVIRGSAAWEDKDGDPHNGSLRYTNEGPTVIKRYGRYYLMYSGGSWDMPSYSLGYASGSRLPASGIPGSDSWQKVVPPLLRSTRWVEGPGHNTLTLAPNNVDDICLYHARGAHFDQPSSRLPFADRLYWNHDRMWMNQPSVGDLTPPDRPQFEERFDGPLSAAWQTSGEWKVEGGQARGSSPALAKVPTEPSSNFLLEVNLRTAGVAGVTVAGVEVMLDYPSQTLRVGASHFPLRGPGFYHQLLVSKNGSRLSAWLDGVEAGSGTVFPGPAAVELSVQQGWANFDGIALTHHFEDSFLEGGALGWESASLWSVEGGAYQGAGLSLKGDPFMRMEVCASMAGPSKGTVGIALSDGRQQVTAGFDRDIWPFARLQISTPEGKFGVGLPRGFLYNSEHTLRVVRHDDAFTFFLDGHETASAWAHLGPTRAGLYADGGTGRFSRCAVKELSVEPNLLLNGGFESDQLDDFAASNPWKMSGPALVAASWSHSGDRRLNLNGGSARQSVRLKPGNYTLHLWGSGHGSLMVQAGGQVLKETLGDDAYAKLSLDFSVAGTAPTEVMVSGQGVGVDDLYLFRR